MQSIIDTTQTLINAWVVGWSAVSLAYDLNLIEIGKYCTRHIKTQNTLYISLKKNLLISTTKTTYSQTLI